MTCGEWKNIGPIDAIKRSVELLKGTWGENAIGNVGMGAVFGLTTFLVIGVGVLLAIASASVSAGLAVTVAVLTGLAVAALSIVQHALSAIYSAVLYRYATVGEAPVGFETRLQGAFASA